MLPLTTLATKKKLRITLRCYRGACESAMLTLGYRGMSCVQRPIRAKCDTSCVHDMMIVKLTFGNSRTKASVHHATSAGPDGARGGERDG